MLSQDNSQKKAKFLSYLRKTLNKQRLLSTFGKKSSTIVQMLALKRFSLWQKNC